MAKKGARNWFRLLDLLTGSGRPRTFWTYVMTVNLFPLYLMNIMFHTMLDAAGIVLRIHYQSMKYDVLFSQGSVHTLFRRGGHFFTHEQKNSSSIKQCKNYNNWSRFPKVMITNVLPPFYGSQCIWILLLVLFPCLKSFRLMLAILRTSNFKMLPASRESLEWHGHRYNVTDSNFRTMYRFYIGHVLLVVGLFC